MKTSYDRLMNWEDFKIILAVARAGGLNAAAKNLGVSHSTVFRQLNAIEERFATRFFERLPQGYELTTAGETAVEFATSMEAGINDLVGKLQGSDSRLQGSIRLTAPIGITHYLLSSHIAEFRRLHPEIDIELIVTSNPLELSRREADVAIRVTKTPPETAIGRKVGVYQMALYASKAYLASVAEKNLTEYDVLTTCNGLDWFPKSIWDNNRAPQVVFSSDSILAVTNAVKAGMGIAILPSFIGTQESDLLALKSPIIELQSDIWLLSHSDLRQTSRVRELMSFLHQRMSQQLLELQAMQSEE